MHRTKRRILLLQIACLLAAVCPLSCERIFPSFGANHVVIAPPDTLVAATIAPRALHTAILTEAHPDTLGAVTLDSLLRLALAQQAGYLHQPDIPKFPVKGVSREELLQTLDILQNCTTLAPDTLKSRFDFYRLNTSLQSDRVRVTGYYTPVFQGSRKHGGAFKYPLLRMPKKKPTAAQARTGKLAGKSLELAWLRSPKDVKNAQMQGSCLVQFVEGGQQFFGFGGAARGGGSPYVFFKAVDETVIGAGNFPLTAGYSVAVDIRYVPIGSTLMAELPELDAAGRVKGYTYRIVFAQDRGGAIQSTKRVDLYCGMGHEALAAAHRINGYGRLWLLLPKR